jgi:hypothetical protein
LNRRPAKRIPPAPVHHDRPPGIGCHALAEAEGARQGLRFAVGQMIAVWRFRT